jgi:hypothetical protein
MCSAFGVWPRRIGAVLLMQLGRLALLHGASRDGLPTTLRCPTFPLDAGQSANRDTGETPMIP